jgi:predicted GNAT family N-acyltransferase
VLARSTQPDATDTRDCEPRGYPPLVEFRIERVEARLTWDLRQAVLRPHQTIDHMALADDDEPSTGSFAAITADGDIVGSVRVAPASPPFSVDTYAPPDTPTWRLRGMATREDVRNAGIGSALLGRTVQHVSDHGGGLLWCNARVPAMNLYRRGGFVEHGDMWEDPDIGPHVVMWRLVQ